MEKTKLELEREREFEKRKDNYEFEVFNLTEDSGIGISTTFDTIGELLHKVKLDVLTLANMNLLGSYIVIKVKEK